MFFEKTECLASTYKSGSLKDKLTKKKNCPNIIKIISIVYIYLLLLLLLLF